MWTNLRRLKGRLLTSLHSWKLTKRLKIEKRTRVNYIQNKEEKGEERKQEDNQLEIEEGKKMMKLETFLFGYLDSPVEFGKEDDEELRDGVDKSSALFFTEKSANSVLSVYEDDAEFRESSDDADEAGQRKPVWVDDEEEKASINIAKVNRLRKLRKEEDESVISGSVHVSRLRAHHVKLNPGTEWAQLDSQPRNCSSDDEDSDIENGVVLALGCKDVDGVDDILQTNEDLVVKSSAKLLHGLLEYLRLVDANSDDLSNAPINSV